VQLKPAKTGDPIPDRLSLPVNDFSVPEKSLFSTVNPMNQ
jgi:hypothetical protein